MVNSQPPNPDSQCFNDADFGGFGRNSGVGTVTDTRPFRRITCEVATKVMIFATQMG